MVLLAYRENGGLGEMEFVSAYEQAFQRWDRQPEAATVSTPYGGTAVHRLAPTEPGPAGGAAPFVMLHGGGATSAVWAHLAPALARARAVVAVDVVGDVGASVPSDRRMTSASAVVGWLDAVLELAAPGRALLLGHSYGAWLATTYGLARPERLAGLTLLDPTAVVAMQRPGVLLRAVPQLLGWVRPTADRARAEIERELAGSSVPSWWLDLVSSAATLPRRYATTKPPGRAVLGGLTVPTLVVMAGRSGMHDVARVADRCRTWLPEVELTTDPDATHYSLPFDASGVVADAIVAWADRRDRPSPPAPAGS